MANEAKQFTIGGVTHDVMDVGARQLIADLQTAINAITSGDTTTEIKTFQEVIDFLDGVTDDATLIGKLNELRTLINAKANDADVVKSVSVNNVEQPKDTNGNVNIEVSGGSSVEPATSTPQMDGTAAIGLSAKYAREDHVHPHDLTKLSKSDVSVETQGDGTVSIRVSDDTYTINFNHTHENMAKLIVCEESDLPSTLDNSTIYVITDSGETEIEKLIIRGMEFAGGGVPAGIIKPSDTTINLGTNYGIGVSKQIEIKANAHITGDLTVGLAANSDLSFDTNNLPSGVTYNSGAGTLTIPQLTAMQGVNITIIYSGSGAAEINGGLVIAGGGVSPKSVVVAVVAAAATYVTNGLVFCLDGADASTSQWFDRIGGIAFDMHNVTVNSDGSVQFNGTNSYGHYANTLGYTPTANTIEVVADMSFTKTQVIFMQNGDDQLVFGTGMRSNGFATLPYSSGSTVKRQFNDGLQQNKLMDGLQVFSISEPSGYRNKTKFTVQNDGFFSKRNEAGTFIGARTSTIDQSWFEGRIYQIRIYNRLLTENEILANQQVDIDRYNIS